MKSRTAFVMVSILALALPLLAQRGGQPAQQQPAMDAVTTEIPGVVRGGIKVEPIKEGFQGTEGPIGAPDGSLLFTETQANRITKIDKDGNTSAFLENTNGSNGLAFDSKGRLISVQTTPGQTRIGVIYPKGSEATLSDKFEGQPFGRPNDLVVDKKGGVYFSEPGPNVQQGRPAPATPPMPPAVYYITPSGQTRRIADGIERPNGIQLSPDEKTLFVANTQGEYVFAFDIQADGSVRNRRNFAKLDGVQQTPSGLNSGADGLAVDSQGRLYAATRIGVQVFSAQGQRLGTIPIPRAPQNLAFAGPDKKTLYVVGRGAAYKIPMLAEGFRGRAK